MDTVHLKTITDVRYKCSLQICPGCPYFFPQVKMTESCKHTNAAYLCVWMSAYVTVHLLGLILLVFSLHSALL